MTPDPKKNGTYEYPFVKITGVIKKVDQRVNTNTGEVYYVHAINLPALKPTDYPPRIAVTAGRELGRVESEVTVVTRCTCRGYKTTNPDDKNKKDQRYSHEFWHQPDLS